MNTQLLKQKVDDVLSLFAGYVAEAADIEQSRKTLESSSHVATEREERLNNTALAQAQERRDLDAQKKYIEEQNKNAQLVMNKIATEKKNLEGLADAKRVIDEEKSQLEIEKKGVEALKREYSLLKEEQERFEQEKQLFHKEKEAIKEEHKLLQIREANIKLKEERIDKIERMTQV